MIKILFLFIGFYVRFILNIFFFVQVTRLLVFPRCWQMSTVQLLILNPEWTDCLCSVLSHPYNTGSSSTPRFRPMDWWVSCFYSYNWKCRVDAHYFPSRGWFEKFTSLPLLFPWACLSACILSYHISGGLYTMLDPSLGTSNGSKNYLIQFCALNWTTACCI